MSFPSLAFRVTEKIIHFFFFSFLSFRNPSLTMRDTWKTNVCHNFRKSLSLLAVGYDRFRRQLISSVLPFWNHKFTILLIWSFFWITQIQPYCWLLDPFNRTGNLLLKSDLNDINYVSQVLAPPQLSQGYSFPQYSSSMSWQQLRRNIY